MAGVLLMFKGPPASGKTTRAKKLCELPGHIRVNKDDIREELFIKDWSYDKEKEVLRRRDFLIEQGLSKGYTVISDDTNLAPKHEARLRELAKKYKAEFSIDDTFSHVPIQECLKRDSERDYPVGEKVIRDMFDKYLASKTVVPYVNDPALPLAIICDIDGTLAIHVDRSPYDTAKCANDQLNKPVYEVLRAFAIAYENSPKFLYVSGREEQFRDVTINWLDTNLLQPGPLWMRPTSDNRNDSIVKREIFDREIRGKYNVLLVLDDRDRVVSMWRQSLGLTCLQVAEGNF